MDYLNRVRQGVDSQLRQIASVKRLLEGKLDRDTYVRYLLRVAHQYAPHSPKVMAIAASRCTDTHPELAAYLLHHAAEEQGHDAWALHDLHDLGVPDSAVKSALPVPSCDAMIGYTYYVAAYANPVGLYGWMYILEAVGHDFGGTAAHHLERGLALGKKALRFVAGHGVADQTHTRELEEKISQYIKREPDVRFVHHVADVSANLYVRMFQEVDRDATP